MSARLGPKSTRPIAAVACATAALVIAGCGSSSSGGRPPSPTVPGAAVLVGKTVPLKAGALTAMDVSAADTAFGFDLFAKLCASSKDGNLVVSPASAAQALGMVDAG